MSMLDPFELWRDLRGLVVDGLDDYRRQVAEITGLPFSRVRALRRLRSGALTHAALAEAMMVDRPAATVAVDDLCARGLTVRAAHPTDRRSKLVSLTAEGRRMVELIEDVVPPPPPGWAQLPPEDIAALGRVLDGVAAARLVGAR
ncbi:MAG TPA: MarR family transcriptional regulator [Pseudonocardia sp.]|jgi:DNA-binding MarR family transcriptional regulator|uniref:MarR family winged helix-turn-helix transcriptional regulator n=1 Tax=Pseudonocardia sp. TaxID=60912 RepID=UPI002EDB7FA3